EYEFNFPMVVGPRFIPGSPTGRSGGGWSPDTSQVPDGSRITPPVLHPDHRSGHDIDLTLYINAGVPIENLHSPSHRISRDPEPDGTETITLDPADTLPNKDFIVRYDVTGQRPEAAVLAHRSDTGGFFTLMLQPQGMFDIGEVTAKEMIFVVDCSGSMSGAPIAQAKALMRKAIREMNPGDSFQIIRFSSAASRFSPLPVPNTPENIRRGLAYVDEMHGTGGTMMIEGIKAALDYPSDPERMRIVLFLTDGYIGNETEILGAIEQKIGQARLFSLGVGSSVNHYLLSRMADAGRGFVQYVRPDEETEPAVALFYDRIRNPLITDISVDWGGLAVRDTVPASIPDLFSEQPVILHGRYETPGRGTVVVRGRMAGKSWKQEIDVRLPVTEPANDVLATLWARTRIRSLMDRLNQGKREDIEKEITDLALTYRLMSQYTAFVAVSEEVRRDPDGHVQTVHIPVEIPESVEYEGIFGQIGGVCMDAAVPAGPPESMANRCLIAPGTSQSRHEVRKKSGGRYELAKEEKTCTTAAVSFSIRGTAGDVTETDLMNLLETLRKDIDTLFTVHHVRGELVVRVSIGSDGRVEKVEIVTNRTGNIEIERNLTRLLKERVTGLPGGEATVALTIN
ncbi:VWA domain-containing protein, partial [bacterium]|nr:VWA domain-containing protein [candidate division CSSED10-310 bacterium]